MLLLASCWQRSAPVATGFGVARVSPDLQPGSPKLLLNDAITVYFSEPVDPMSITRDSFAVRNAEGHSVRGRLRVDGAWVTFEPEPPLCADLLDGSFQPDCDYRLVVSGYPRPDGVRSQQGALLREGLQRPFRTAARSVAGLPAPLRPLHADSRPFLLRPSEIGSAPLPVDDARLQMHFTLPVLPTSATAAAFEISLLRRNAPVSDILRVEARAVRLLPQQAGDDFPGSTVEIEFGAQVRILDADRFVTLQPEDLLVVRLVLGDSAVCDYAGRQPPLQVQWCNVVPGIAVKVAGWPTAEGPLRYLDTDLAAPGFEVTDSLAIQPLVRIEAGDGSLGVFRPLRDTAIAIGEPFDRGDGTRVASADGVFAFQAIDIPAGVTVRVDARARPIQLLALARARVAGRIEVIGDAVPVLLHAGQFADVTTVAAGAALTVIAGSGIEVVGVVDGEASSAGAPLALVTSGALEVAGSIPLESVLATERGGLVAPRAADRCLAVRVQLTPGLPPGATAVASGYTPFCALPVDRGVGSVRLVPADTAVRVAWQVLPPDPVQRTRPDLDPARAAPPRDLFDNQRIEAVPGSFLRLRCQARVVGGESLPRLLGVDVLDR